MFTQTAGHPPATLRRPARCRAASTSPPLPNGTGHHRRHPRRRHRRRLPDHDQGQQRHPAGRHLAVRSSPSTRRPALDRARRGHLHGRRRRQLRRVLRPPASRCRRFSAIGLPAGLSDDQHRARQGQDHRHGGQRHRRRVRRHGHRRPTASAPRRPCTSRSPSTRRPRSPARDGRASWPASPGITVFSADGYPQADAQRRRRRLPAGVTFVDNGNGTATLSGTAGAAARWAPTTITVRASNGVDPDAMLEVSSSGRPRCRSAPRPAERPGRHRLRRPDRGDRRAAAVHLHGGRRFAAGRPEPRPTAASPARRPARRAPTRSPSWSADARRRQQTATKQSRSR